MKYCFLASLANLRFDKLMGKGWELAGALRITNSKSIANRLIHDEVGGSRNREPLDGPTVPKWMKA